MASATRVSSAMAESRKDGKSLVCMRISIWSVSMVKHAA